MAAVLLDTHVWAWVLAEQFRVPGAASRAIEATDAVLVSPISFYEIEQRVRIGKWPEMASSASILPELLAKRGSRVAQFTGTTAILHHATLISTDEAFDGLAAQPDWPGRIW